MSKQVPRNTSLQDQLQGIRVSKSANPTRESGLQFASPPAQGSSPGGANAMTGGSAISPGGGPAAIQWRKDRVGRAPYNFVPPPTDPMYVPKPVGLHDRYAVDSDGNELLSGYLDLTLTAKSPFYVRGMWGLAKFEKERKEIKDQSRPYEISHDRLRLPGSSMRGMIRTLVEILAEAPLEPINADLRMFYRSVGSSDDEDDPSFDPNGKEYKERIWDGDGSRARPAIPIVKVGYLDTRGKAWKITPAIVGPHGTQWYRVNMRGKIEKNPVPPDPIWFRPVAPTVEKYPHSRVWGEYGLVTTIEDRNPANQQPPKPGLAPGYLIRSGQIQRKYMQWIIHEKDNKVQPISVPDDDKEAFIEDDFAKKYFEPSEADQPCFYTSWTDKAKKAHISFGHTPYFRLPYLATPGDANRWKRNGSLWDLAQVIFGRVSAKTGEGAASRVYFEDAFLSNSAAVLPMKTTVLGTPKPTMYQHYLQQVSVEQRDIQHWDHPDAALRGFKRYWHRRGARLPMPPNQNRKTVTEFCPVGEGCEFQSRIRYENLNKAELGALLTAIQLRSGCLHQLGMAKPYGYGAFEISVVLHETTRRKRYAGFFAPDGSFESAAVEATQERCSSVRQEFAKEMGYSSEDEMWSSDRLAELLTMLKDDVSAQERHQWLMATRNLRFGPLLRTNPVTNTNGEETFTANEFLYNYSGDNPRRASNARRRALPPATVVRRMDLNEIPTDPSPFGSGA